VGRLQAFIARELSEIEVEYLFVDAVFEALRRHGAKEALLVGWCIDSDGRKHLLHLAVGNKESEACWTEFFRDMLNRGLRMPTTITSDGAPGLVKAIGVCFPASIRLRCWFHRLANIRAKLPNESAADVMAHLYAVRDAPTLDAARAAADRLINTDRRECPAASACFADDLDALLAIHRVPVRHRIRVRTTNLAERCFVEERRRTKVIGRFGDEHAAMKLVYAVMIRAADAGAGTRSATSNATSSSCCAPNSASTHRRRTAAPRPTDAEAPPHDQAGRRFTGRSGLDPGSETSLVSSSPSSR
jgi:transposase-like protein